MPEISRFYGIVIMMFAKDHVPPHFHARYGEHEALFAIDTGEVIDGKFPRRAAKLVQEWANLYKKELLEIIRSHKSRLRVFTRYHRLIRCSIYIKYSRSRD